MPQEGQTKPVGQRRSARYCEHASSSENLASNAGPDIGLSFFHLAGIRGTTPEHYRSASPVALHRVPPDQKGISLYKGSKDDLSSHEINAVESLGLLTKSGDDIIKTLISENERSLKYEEYLSSQENEKLTEAGELTKLLHEYYGQKISEITVDYELDAEDFLKTLAAVN